MQRIIRLNEVKHLTGLSKSTIYLLIRKEVFPKSIKITDRTSGWMENDISDWIKSKTEGNK